LVLFLHGAGERGSDLELVKKWGPPRQVAEGKELPFLLISPQCPENEPWNVGALEKLVESVAAEFPVDSGRIYVTGLSMGGYGTWHLLARRPDLFAAGVPICGGGNPADAESLKEIPIWAFHGDQDAAVPLSKSQEMVTAIQKAGGKQVQLTVYPGVGHNSWSPTYDNPDVYQWLLGQKRADR
jgi:predicted peptidase